MKGKNKSILSTDVPEPTSQELTLVTCISLGNWFAFFFSFNYLLIISFFSIPPPPSTSLLSVEYPAQFFLVKCQRVCMNVKQVIIIIMTLFQNWLRKMIMERNKARLFKEMSKTCWEIVLNNTKWVRMKQCGTGSNKRLSPHFPLLLFIIFEWVWVVFLLGEWQSSTCSMILRVQLHLLSPTSLFASFAPRFIVSDQLTFVKWTNELKEVKRTWMMFLKDMKI